MPKFTFTSPGGQSYDIDGPEGATQEQAFAMLQQHLGQQPAAPDPMQHIDRTQGMGAGERFAAGAGAGMSRAYRGLQGVPQAGDLVDAMTTHHTPRLDALAAEEQQARSLEAPLMDTAAGKAGNVVGTAAALAPIALVPGANTYAGAAMMGGVASAATTPGGLKERGQAGLGGAIGGFTGKGLGDALAKGGRAALDYGVRRGAAKASDNAVRDTALAEGQAAGLVVPPATSNPTLLNKTAEGFAGKITTAQKASNLNAPKLDALARQELGMGADAPITPEALAGIRKSAGQAYEAVSSTGTIRPSPKYAAAIDAIQQPFRTAAKGFPNAKPNPILTELEGLKSPEFDAAAAVAKIRELRDAADAAYRGGSKEAGKAYKQAGKALEDAIDEHLQAIGAPRELLDGYRGARELIAKTYTVEKALEGGNVSATKLAAMLTAKKPLSGTLAMMGRFGQSFPKAAQSPAKVGSVAGTSPLDWAVGAAGAMHNPLLLGAVVARPTVRNALLLGPVNRLAAAPKYGPNALSYGVVNAVEHGVTRGAITRAGTAYGAQK